MLRSVSTPAFAVSTPVAAPVVARSPMLFATPIATLIAALLATSACTPLPTSTAKAASPVVRVANVAGPDGAALVQACTPTGPELCFNAIDDNCNGIIDEGCGEGTGLLQFTIAWGDSPADVNLAVTTPGQERVPNAAGGGPPGFVFGGDCPGTGGCGGQSVENVYFDGPEPPRGHYNVEIALADLHGAKPPIDVRFGARLGGRSLGFAVALAPGDTAKKTFSFDVQ